MNTITQQELKELLDYDKDTGVLKWKKRANKQGIGGKTWNTRYAGKQSGYVNPLGYLEVKINDRNYLSHRLAWMYMYGSFPKNQIDHINGITDDNRLCNLREATNSENQQNKKKAQSNNKNGFLGVSLHKKSNTFRARIKINKKEKNLGYFKTAEQAHEAYLKAKREFHPFGEL